MGVTTLCATYFNAFIGLVADRVHDVVPPANKSDPERWVYTYAAQVSPDSRIANSFTGAYLQVEPDDRDDYNRIEGPQSFTQTYIRYMLRIEIPGVHALFTRWSGGDTYGGGDSFYAVIVDSTGQFISGLPTFRPTTELISETKYNGCCYDTHTHVCSCLSIDTGGTCEDDDMRFVDVQSAKRFGIQCPVGRGEFESVPAPIWYEFAGGNVLDFDEVPWDATCEAEGTGTADSGADFAQWQLEIGDYELRFYPREDGTAFEAFYLAGPDANAPASNFRLSLGNSTVCLDHSSHHHKKDDNTTVIIVVVVLLCVLVPFLCFFLLLRYRRLGACGERISEMWSSTSNLGELQNTLRSENTKPDVAYLEMPFSEEAGAGASLA